MALNTAPTSIAALRGSTPVLRVIEGRKHDKRPALEETRMELHAAGLDMQGMAQRIDNALLSGHYAAVHQLAGRLWQLGANLTDTSGDAA